MKQLKKIFLFLVLVLVQAACAKESALIEKTNGKVEENGRYGNDSTDTEPTFRMLFVGNSLTYTNDLPILVETIAAQHDIQLKTEILAYPNYALEDHWNDGNFQKLMNEKDFNYVVVQQGPSSQQDGRKMLMDYGARFKKICDEKGARLVFFMVWPARANYQTFGGVIKNYRDAAEANESMLCPVGEEWMQYINQTQDYSYYGPDGFHPSLEGSNVAAEIIFRSIFTN